MHYRTEAKQGLRYLCLMQRCDNAFRRPPTKKNHAWQYILGFIVSVSCSWFIVPYANGGCVVCVSVYVCVSDVEFETIPYYLLHPERIFGGWRTEDAKGLSFSFSFSFSSQVVDYNI
jgi:hypothetical protein